MSGATFTIPNTEALTGRIDLMRNAATDYWLGTSVATKGWKPQRPCVIKRFRVIWEHNSVGAGANTDFDGTLYNGADVAGTIAGSSTAGRFHQNATLDSDYTTVTTSNVIYAKFELEGGNVGPVTAIIEVEYL